MKLVKRLTAATVALAVAAPCTAFAANVVYYNADNATVEYSYDTAATEVSVVVHKDNDTAKVANVDQILGDGAVVTGTFTMPDDHNYVPTGKYVVDVRDTEGNLVGNESFWHVDPEDPATIAAVGAIAGLTDPTALATAITTNAAGLGVDTNDDVAGISNYLVYFDLSAQKFAKSYAYAKLLNTVKNANEAIVTAEITKFANAKLLGIDDATAYAGYPEAVRTEVATKLANAVAMFAQGNIDSPEFKDEFVEWVALARLNQAPTAVAVEEILFNSGYGSIFNLNMTAYNASGYKTEILTDMIAYNFTSKEMVASTFLSESTESRGNGGGGGGAPSGPVYPDEENDNTGSGGNVIIPSNPSEIKGRYLDDVGGHWAETMINDLHSKGIVNGSDNKFYPNNNITRAEFCTLIAQAFYKNKTGSTSSFGDVTPDDWYYSYVGLLNAKGIVSGMGDGTFGAGRNITRQDMAAIIARCMKDLGKSTEATREMAEFTDAAEIASYSAEAIEMLYTANIISGYEDGSFNPTANLTKAEAATVIFKLLNK